MAAALDGWHRVANLGDLVQPGDRKHVVVNGRYVSVVRGLDGRVHCLDSVCYHTGGPLLLGDIEEVNGWECVRCPWHNYPVRLVDGAKAYKQMEAAEDGKLLPAGWKLSEHRQRVHAVEERGDGIFVRLSSEERVDRHAVEELECESDRWAYNTNAANNVLRHVGGRAEGKLRHATY